MATTITRDTLVDDSGTPDAPVGDGTPWGNAQLWEMVYDRIDQLLANNLTFGGTVSAEGFGTHLLQAGGAGAHVLVVRNTSAGTGNYAGVHVGTDAAQTVGQFVAFSSTYATSGGEAANAVMVRSHGANGLRLQASHASGGIRFYTGGNTLRLVIGASGEVELGDHTTYDSAQYAPIGVTRPSTSANLAYYALVKTGTVAWSMGIDANDRFIIGHGIAGGGKTLTPLLRLSSTQILAPAGTAAGPGIAGLADTDTGIYWPTTNQLALAVGGVARLTVASTGVTVGALRVTNNGELGIQFPGTTGLEDTGFLTVDGTQIYTRIGGNYIAVVYAQGMDVTGWMNVSNALRLQEVAETPGAAPAAGTEAQLYIKADKLVIRFNDGGTERYYYLDLTAGSGTWAHTTSAP